MLFRYEAISYEAGREIGQIEAPDIQKAIEKIRAKRRVVIKLTEVKEFKFKFFKRTRVINAQEVALFCRQLGAMYNAGISLRDALVAIREGAAPRLKTILTQVTYELEKGQSLSESFGREWPVLFRHSIAVAEETGNIEPTLTRLAKHYEAQARLRGKILAAMTYPGIVLFISLAAIVFLIVFVLPQFLNLFQGLNLGIEDLPGTTRAVIGLSNFVSANWPLLLGGGAVLGLALYFGSKSGPGAILFDAIILRLPLIGRMREMSYALTFVRNLEAMYSAGIPVLQALELNRKLINNRRWSQALEKIMGGLRRGLTISEQIEKERVFPSMLKKLISTGERSGRLPEILDRAGSFFEEEIELAANKLTSWIEPVMLVVLGSSTAFILLAVLTPIFKAAGNVAKFK